jgi:hypothetical protein
MPAATPQLEVIAKRVAWWKLPVDVLANPNDFLCRVMVFGLWSDLGEIPRKLRRTRSILGAG